MIDPAVFACCDNTLWNAFFRNTNYENSLVIDGQNQVRRNSSSNWLKPASSSVTRWLSQETFELVEGKQIFNKGLSHSRLLFEAKNDYWLVLDEVQPSSPDNTIHWYNQYWYLTPGAVGMGQNGWVYLEREGQRFCLAQQTWAGTHIIPMNTKITEGTGELSRSPQPKIETFHRAPTVVQSFNSSEALLSATVIQAENEKTGNLLSISRLPARDGAIVICLQFEKVVDYFYLNNSSETEITVRFGDFRYKGDFCHVRLDEKGHATEVRTAPTVQRANLFSNFRAGIELTQLNLISH